jgi:hypothetical protein
MLNGRPDRPVTVSEEALQHLDIVVAFEAIRVIAFRAEALALEVDAADLEPVVVLAGRNEPL